MAIPGYVTTLLGGLSADVKATLVRVFDYVLPNNKLGPVEHQAKLESFQGYYVQSTTPSTANQDFSVLHGLGRTPYVLVPVLPLDSTGHKTVRLVVGRAADSKRVYLRSPETSAPITLWVE